MATKRVKLSDLTPDRRNANRHSERGTYMVGHSLEELGAGRSIVVDKDGNIVAGNLTAEQAAAMGIEDVIIVETDGRQLVAVQRTDWDLNDPKGAARQYAYADNQAAKVSIDFDPEVIAADLEAGVELGDWFTDFDLQALGIDAGPEEADAAPQIDRAEELREQWGVEAGQLWVLPSRTAGQEHRLICGDCTDRAVVERVMGGERAELLFTSPPYADMREYSGNDLSLEKLVEIFQAWVARAQYFAINLGVQFKDGEVYRYWDHWIASAQMAGLKLLSWNVWDRINATSVSAQTKMFGLQHEWVFVFGDSQKEINRTWEKSEESRKRERYYAVNDRGQKITTRRQPDGSVKNSVIGTIYTNKNMGTVFTGYAEMARDLDHPARFPVDFPMGYVGAMTNEGDIVADPFGGSGTTMVACEQLGRQCRMVEIAPGYTAVVLQRMLDAFGIRGELAGQL